MSRIASTNNTEILLNSPRLNWNEFASVLIDLGEMLNQADISSDIKKTYLENIQSLNAGAKAVLFIQQEYNNIITKKNDETRKFDAA